MLALVLASMAAPAGGIAPSQASAPAKEPTRYCREMSNASSRLYAVKVCKTRAQWRRWETCHGSVTRYCSPKKRVASLGRPTAFPLNEDSRIICRMLAVTGTRIRKAEACLPKREWDRMWRESSEGMLERQLEHSTLNRGSSL